MSKATETTSFVSTNPNRARGWNYPPSSCAFFFLCYTIRTICVAYKLIRSEMLDCNQAFHSLISFMKNKITIIGAGMVGSCTAYSLLASNDVEEIALIDINHNLARAQAMDLQHAVPFLG